MDCKDPVPKKVRTTYLGHRKLALEAASHPVIDTLGFPPCLLHALIPVRLVAPATNSMVKYEPHEIMEKSRTDLKGLVRFLMMGILTMAHYRRRIVSFETRV